MSPLCQHSPSPWQVVPVVHFRVGKRVLSEVKPSPRLVNLFGVSRVVLLVLCSKILSLQSLSYFSVTIFNVSIWSPQDFLCASVSNQQLVSIVRTSILKYSSWEQHSYTVLASLIRILTSPLGVSLVFCVHYFLPHGRSPPSLCLYLLSPSCVESLAASQWCLALRPLQPAFICPVTTSQFLFLHSCALYDCIFAVDVLSVGPGCQW